MIVLVLLQKNKPSIYEDWEENAFVVKVEMNDYIRHQDLLWFSIPKIIQPFKEVGMERIEIGDFKWSFPPTWIEMPIPLESDPILIQSDNSKYDLKPLKKWRKRNSDALVYVQFGEWVHFQTVVDVINILQTHPGSVELSTYEDDINSIYVDVHECHHDKKAAQPEHGAYGENAY